MTKRVLIVSADDFEDSELIEPLTRLKGAGADVAVAAPAAGEITGKHGKKVTADLALSDVASEDYDVLVLPGGRAPAALRQNHEALTIASAFMKTGRPVAAICHGPQILASARLLSGRRATSYRSVRPEVEAAGARYEDQEVVVDRNLITSRQPSDIPAFISEILKVAGLAT
jgi:protease I